MIGDAVERARQIAAARDALGLPFTVWLFLTLLFWFALFFKFGRFWSVRNLDLVLLLAQVPALLHLTIRTPESSWAYALLFVALGVWSIRCLVDLALTRRPLLEPNLNAAGLTCLLSGLLALVAVEAILVERVDARKGAGDPKSVASESPRKVSPSPSGAADAVVSDVAEKAPATGEFKRLLAAVGHVGVTLGLVAIGARHFGRPLVGLGMGVGFLILPYTRIALVDSGQLVGAALTVLAVAAYRRPALAGLALALGGGWMPPIATLIPAWAGFYWGRGARRFLAAAVPVLLAAWLIGATVPAASRLALACGARGLAEVGLLPTSEIPDSPSFWKGVIPAYRLPVVVLHAFVVAFAAFWPAGKNLGQIIALSALLLITSEFWYLNAGGTHAVLYLPLLLMMTFRPNLSLKRPPLPEVASREEAVAA